MASSSPQALLLVDGYNVIGTWPELKDAKQDHGLETARRDLVEALVNYTAHQGFQTEVVFDAHYQDTPSHQEQYHHNLTISYTGFSETADSYIEKICAGIQTKLALKFARVIVATSDQAQRHTVVGYGAEWMSSQKLQHEVISAQRVFRQGQKKQKYRPKPKFLLHSMDPRVKARLQQFL